MLSEQDKSEIRASDKKAIDRTEKASRDASTRRSSRQRQCSACAPENLSGGWLRIWASMCGPWLHGPIMYEGRKKTDAKL